MITRFIVITATNVIMILALTCSQYVNHDGDQVFAVITKFRMIKICEMFLLMLIMIHIAMITMILLITKSRIIADISLYFVRSFTSGLLWQGGF